jgi:hypothetical protein
MEQAQHTPAFEENLTATVLRHLAITWGRLALNFRRLLAKLHSRLDDSKRRQSLKLLFF